MPYTEHTRGSGVCEVRTTGAKANGGYYDSTISGAGTDYTQQDAAQLSLTDLATSGAGSTTLTSVTGGFTAAMVGNAINITSGTNFDVGADATSVYWITGYTNSNTVTVDRTPTGGGAGSAGVGKVGGARASIGGAMANAASGQRVYVKGGTYTVGSGTVNTHGNAVKPPAGSATYGTTTVIGYGTTRGDMALLVPVVHTYHVAGTFCDVSNGGVAAYFLTVEGGSTASSFGFNTGSHSQVVGCVAQAMATGFRGANGQFVCCLADGCTNGFGDGVSAIIYCSRCWAKGSTGGYGFYVASAAVIDSCVASGGSTNGFYSNTSASFLNCTAYGNAASGFIRANATLTRATSYTNCLSVSNTGYGFEDQSSQVMTLVTCASYGNSTARSTGVSSLRDMGALALAGDPFVAAASNDFRLNDRGAGLVARTGGTYNTWPGYSTLLQNQMVGAIPTLAVTPYAPLPTYSGWPNGG